MILADAVLGIECGSGLSSLAARRLGRDAFSIDFDPQSVRVASPEKDLRPLSRSPIHLSATVGGSHGCDEFVFRRSYH
jgi:ribosomal protein L11 methylase PrmA